MRADNSDNERNGDREKEQKSVFVCVKIKKSY